MAEHKVKIVVCMGSSCFSRGNNKAILLLQDYLTTEQLENKVWIEDSLCEEECKTGPHIVIEGTDYREVSPETVVDLLKFHLEKKLTEQTDESASVNLH